MDVFQTNSSIVLKYLSENNASLMTVSLNLLNAPLPCMAEASLSLAEPESVQTNSSMMS